MCTHTCTRTSTGALPRVRGLRARPFSITPPCRQLHSVFGGSSTVIRSTYVPFRENGSNCLCYCCCCSFLLLSVLLLFVFVVAAAVVTVVVVVVVVLLFCCCCCCCCGGGSWSTSVISCFFFQIRIVGVKKV